MIGKDLKVTFSLLFLAIFISFQFNSMLLDKFSVFLVLVTCILSGKKEARFMNPFYLFAITPLSLLAYVNVGSFYMLDLKHETYQLAILNMAAFVFAIKITRGAKNVPYYAGINLSSHLIVHAIILYLLGFSARFFPSLSSVLWVFSIGAITCAVKSKNKIMLVFVAFIVGSSILFGKSKMIVLLNLLTFLITYEKYYIKTLKQRRKLLIYSLIGVCFMIYAFSFANKDRGDYDANDGLHYYSQQGVDWSLDASFFLPYMYFTTAWSNLQYVTETQTKSTEGLWTLKPLLGYAQFDDDFEKEYELESYSSFNTFTYIVCAYKDFGFYGSVFMSLFLGFFVKKVYSKYQVSQSPFDVAIYACVSLAVVEMFFSNHFFMQSYPFTIFILMKLYRFFTSPRVINKSVVLN
ncbi:O-antigen polymerase [Polaribacter sp. P097]|uniref:O-antigen polymerase n=1 Tax=Polaribacter sp. P097 TaxID=3117398 RepID=UPI002FE2AD20